MQLPVVLFKPKPNNNNDNNNNDNNNNNKSTFKKFVYFVIFRKMEHSGSNIKTFLIYSHISGNGNRSKKLLLCFWKWKARKIRKTSKNVPIFSYISENEVFWL